jgi:hypothetical protein
MFKNNFGFLILGAGRGGTSLLAGLLDQHSQLEVGFEKFSIEFLMGQKIYALRSQIFDERVRAFLTHCQQEAIKYPTKIWGNKITTEQLFGLEDTNIANPEAKIDILDRFFNGYLSDIKIIFILRDGRTCVKSKVSRTGISLEAACERWKFSVKVYRFLKNNHHNNICIKFEDLLTQPSEILKSICNFLTILYEDSMLKGTLCYKMLPEYRQTGFDLSKLELHYIPQGCDQLIYEELKFCHYV